MTLSQKGLVFFMFLFAVCTFLSNVLDKKESYLVTELTEAISTTDLVIPVVDGTTEQWPDSAHFWIGDEYTKYASKTAATFVVDEGDRGLTYGSIITIPATHASGSLVKAPEADLLNVMMGYSTIVITTNIGDLAGMIIEDPAFFLKAIWKMVIWDYSFLEGEIGVVKFLFLYPVSAGFILTAAMTIAQFVKYMLKLL